MNAVRTGRHRVKTLGVVAISCGLLVTATAVLLGLASSPPLGGGAAHGVSRVPGRAPFEADVWKTDFSKAAVDLETIVSGGVPRDGIPPLHNPKFVAVAAAAVWLRDREPVIALEVNGDVRAYPLQVMTWHEIVNDTVGGVPVAVTFCPLCNSAIAFERRVDGTTLDLGTTGKLLNSDLIMWDRQTESWWQQLTGDAIVGSFTGKRLEPLSTSLIAWGQFQRTFPGGRVLSRETGFSRPYGENPYAGYDDVGSSPFLFRGRTDGRLSAMARVVTVTRAAEDVAYPYETLQQLQAVHDKVSGADIVVLWAPGAASALDTGHIPDGREVGATGVFDRTLQGRLLTFSALDGGLFRDAETGSMWDILGKATAGALAGASLTPVVHGDQFWFAWAAFRPDTRVYTRVG